MSARIRWVSRVHHGDRPASPLGKLFGDSKSQSAAVLEADFSNEELVAMMPSGSEAGITPERRSEVLAEVDVDDIAELAEKLFAQGGRAEVLVLPK